MKRSFYPLFALIALFVVFSALWAGEKRTRKDAVFGDIVADSITVRSKDGKQSITITGTEESVYLHAFGNKKKTGYAMIASEPGTGVWFGVHDGGELGCPIALAVKDGKTFLQIIHKDKVRHVSIKEIVKALGYSR